MAENWIGGATKHAHGQFRAKAQAAGESTATFAREHEHDSGKTGKQARLAETLMGLHHKHESEHAEMHARHEREHHEMGKRHEDEAKQLHAKHQAEIGGHGNDHDGDEGQAGGTTNVNGERNAAPGGAAAFYPTMGNR